MPKPPDSAEQRDKPAKPEKPETPGKTETFEAYKRPTLPHEREADPAFRAGGLATAGMEFAIVVGLFVLGGRWLDGKLDAEPWFTILLTLIGVAAAMTLLIRHAIRLGGPRKPPPDDPMDTPSGRAP